MGRASTTNRLSLSAALLMMLMTCTLGDDCPVRVHWAGEAAVKSFIVAEECIAEAEGEVQVLNFVARRWHRKSPWWRCLWQWQMQLCFLWSLLYLAQHYSSPLSLHINLTFDTQDEVTQCCAQIKVKSIGSANIIDIMNTACKAYCCLYYGWKSEDP